MVSRHNDIRVSLWPSWRGLLGASVIIAAFCVAPFVGLEPVSAAICATCLANSMAMLIRDRHMLSAPDARRYVMPAVALLFCCMGVLLAFIGSQLLAQRLVSASAIYGILMSCILLFAARHVDAIADEPSEQRIAEHWALPIANIAWLILNEAAIAIGDPAIWLGVFVFAFLFVRQGRILALRHLVSSHTA